MTTLSPEDKVKKQHRAFNRVLPWIGGTILLSFPVTCTYKQGQNNGEYEANLQPFASDFKEVGMVGDLERERENLFDFLSTLPSPPRRTLFYEVPPDLQARVADSFVEQREQRDSVRACIGYLRGKIEDLQASEGYKTFFLRRDEYARLEEERKEKNHRILRNTSLFYFGINMIPIGLLILSGLIRDKRLKRLGVVKEPTTT